MKEKYFKPFTEIEKKITVKARALRTNANSLFKGWHYFFDN